MIFTQLHILHVSISVVDFVPSTLRLYLKIFFWRACHGTASTSLSIMMYLKMISPLKGWTEIPISGTGLSIWERGSPTKAQVDIRASIDVLEMLTAITPYKFTFHRILGGDIRVNDTLSSLWCNAYTMSAVLPPRRYMKMLKERAQRYGTEAIRAGRLAPPLSTTVYRLLIIYFECYDRFTPSDHPHTSSSAF